MSPTSHGNQRAFTLTELMIMVAVMAILITMAIPRFASLVTKSKEAGTKGSLGSIRSAISLYYYNNEGQFPEDDLTSLTQGVIYLKEIPLCYTPPYHERSRVVETCDTYTPAGVVAVDNGHWKYFNWQNLMVSGRDWGDVWVGCSHYDTKGVIWSPQ